VLDFLLNLFKYNDNTRNSFSDNYYRAALVTALGNLDIINSCWEGGDMSTGKSERKLRKDKGKI
jgi:hypothetical protein